MGPGLDLKRRKETAMEASTSKVHTPFMPMSKDKNMRRESKREVKLNMGVSLNKQDLEVSENEDMDVDIINCTNDDDVEDVKDVVEDVVDIEDVEVDIINCTKDDDGVLVQTHSDDATASSSSFSETYSDVGNCSDSEVMSELRGDAAPMLGFGGSSDLFPMRKKRATSHWRKFVQPIMWRCKWVELQLRKFQSKAIKYEKELEKHNQTNQLKYGNFGLDGCCAKSMPFFHDSQREKSMKRKIRKRHEEPDTEVYMSQHNLFSYFASCRSSPHGPAIDEDQTNLAPPTDKNTGNEFRVPGELLSLDFRDDYLLEKVLWKIEVSQSQVCEMKTRLDTVMSENAGRISSSEDLSFHEANNASTCSVRDHDLPSNMVGPSVVADFASQLIQLNTGNDLVKPDGLVKPETAATEQPSDASRKRSADGILIYNRRVKKPQPDSGAVKIHPIEKLQVPNEEKSNNTDSVSVSEDSSQNEQPPRKLRSVTNLSSPQNKKKRAARARRKSGSSLWSRRNSG